MLSNNGVPRGVGTWCAGGCRDLETEATMDQRKEIAYVVVWSVDFECCGSAASAGKGMGKWD